MVEFINLRRAWLPKTTSTTKKNQTWFFFLTGLGDGRIIIDMKKLLLTSIFVCCATVESLALEFHNEAKNDFLDRPSPFAGSANIDLRDKALGEIDATLESLGAKQPDAQYRLSLRPKGGRKNLSLGLIKGNEEFPVERVRNAVKNALVEKQIEKKLKKPKPKPFKQTVVLDDGGEIFKDVKGVTHVPRMPPKRRSAKNYLKLRSEASRQAERAREIEKENAAATKAYERMREDMMRSVTVNDQEIDDALQKYVLLIERNREDPPKEN